MIVLPQNDGQWNGMARFLQHYAGVAPSTDLRVIGWEEGGVLKMVVGMDGFLGNVCQMHVAMAPGYRFTPRALLRYVFDYAFRKTKRAKVLGIVNSFNEHAMRYDAHLGFKEIFRLPGAHEEGGDLVVMSLGVEECVYLEPEEVEEPMKKHPTPCQPQQGGKGSPPAPDYTGAANAQAAASKEITRDTTYANRPSINTPWGSQTWNTGQTVDPSSGQNVTSWTQDISLSPDQRAAEADQQEITRGRSAAAKNLLGQATNAFGSPMDWSKLPGTPGSIEDAQKGAFATMSAALQPQRDQSEAGLENKLANMGLPRGSEAWSRAKEQMSRENDATDRGLMSHAMAEGRNSTTAQMALRNNAIAEEAQRRGMSLNELNALLTGQQVSMPQGMSGAPSSTANASQTPDLLGAAQAQGNFSSQQAAASAGGTGAAIGGVAALAGTALAVF